MKHSVAILAAVGCAAIGFQAWAAQDPEAGQTSVRPPLLFSEAWKYPPAGTEIEDRHVTQQVVSHPDLELKVYGPDAKAVSVNAHEKRFDLWNGDAASPVAITLRHRSSYLDLTGLARLRWIVRTQGLHRIHPVLKLADGTLIAGTHADETDGVFLQTEIAFTNQRWYKLDPVKVTTSSVVANPDLSKVDEIGWVDLAPGGGRGNAGWANVSTIELYAKAVPR